MGIFDKSDEQRRAEAKRADLVRKRQIMAAFAASPQGMARAARMAGRKIFQAHAPISQTTGHVAPLVGSYSTTTGTMSAAGLIESIESEGWILIDAGYVFRVTGTISQDRVLSSAEREATSGEVIGVYLFRATEGPPPINEEIANKQALAVDYTNR